MSIFGQPTPQQDGPAKAAGALRFLTDLRLDGMCHGAVVRCPHGHARVRAVDASKALCMEGVLAVVTPADAPMRLIPGEHFYDKRISQRPVLFDEPTWSGAPVAAVVAETAALAAHAARNVEVDYEVLPTVSSLDEALAERVRAFTNKANAALPFGPVRLDRGDVDAAFDGAHHVVEDTYQTATVQAAAWEPYAVVVEPHEDGGLTVHKGTPAPFLLREQMAVWLGVAANRVRVVCPPVGGGFGSRMDDLEYIATLLAKRVKRPVRVVLSRGEGFIAGRVRHGARLTVRSALDGDGRLLGRDLTAWYDVGGHLDLGPYVILRALRPLALYKTDNLRFRGHLLYTNRPVSGATRGFGNPQATFAIESHNARLCNDLGIDLGEFRRRHLLRANETNVSLGVVDTATGVFKTGTGNVSSCELQACIERVTEALASEHSVRDGEHRRGVGTACGMHTTGKGRKEVSTASVEWLADDRIVVSSGAPDQGGTGVATSLAMIAGDVFNVPISRIEVRLADTERELQDSGAHASGRTYVAGEAVLHAAEQVKARLDQGDPLPIAEQYRHKPTSNAPPFCCCGAVVEIDVSTGICKVTRLVVAVDIGQVLNPMHARGQVIGAAVQGIGFALYERLDFDATGALQTHGLRDYGLPRAADVPDVEVHFVPSHEPTHPLGVKGVGEIGLMAVAPAIANAIADATGVWPTQLPVTPESVWRGLQASGE
jgi:putative selenate reductase molybdopterin-binding subunit